MASNALQERDPNANPAALSHPASWEDKPAKGNKKASTPTTDKAAPKPPSAADLSDIQLDGEMDDTVSIYDTCDDVRKKVRVHVAKPGVTQAGFARDLSELMTQGNVTSAQVTRFLKFKGARAGGHSPVFYAGYVYFEKLRIRQGKKKSAKREKMEDAWEMEGGLPREGSHKIHLLLMKGQSWKFDSLGKIQVSGAPSRRGGISTKKARH